MQLIRKIPFLLGWAVSYLSTLLLISLLGLGVFPSLSDLFSRLNPTVGLISVIVPYALISFLAFTVSIGKVVLPLYRIGRIHSNEHTKVTLGSYLLRWILYLVSYLVYCIPLGFHGFLPKEIEGPIYLVWQILAGFLAYRGVVRSWLNDIVLHGQQPNEEQTVAA